MDELQAGIKIAERDINNFRYTDDATLIQKAKNLLMRVKDKSEKAGLKFIIKKVNIVVSNYLTTLQIEGKTVETISDCLFLGSKTTVNDDCSH